jgi:hypothetical protein
MPAWVTRVVNGLVEFSVGVTSAPDDDVARKCEELGLKPKAAILIPTAWHLICGRASIAVNLLGLYRAWIPDVAGQRTRNIHSRSSYREKWQSQ